MALLILRLVPFALIVLAAYLVIRIFKRRSQKVTASTPMPTAVAVRDDSIYSGEVLLTGHLRLQVVSSATGQPVPGRRVSFESSGFS